MSSLRTRSKRGRGRLRRSSRRQPWQSILTNLKRHLISGASLSPIGWITASRSPIPYPAYRRREVFPRCFRLTIVEDPNRKLPMKCTGLLPVIALGLALASPGFCQSSPADGATPSTPVILSADQQIAAAVLALPKEFRETATVMGYGTDGRLKELRHGQGPMVCLATDPASERFHVACYHRSLEPFMARGRALRARGVKGDQVDTVRFAEVRSGKLAFPSHPASLYSLSGPKGSYNPESGVVTGGRSLYVVYIKGATGASTGLPTAPVEGSTIPWIMHPGTPKAHIMFVPAM